MNDSQRHSPGDRDTISKRDAGLFLVLFGGFVLLVYLIFQSIWIAEYLNRLDVAVRSIEPACYIEERWEGHRHTTQKSILFVPCDEVERKTNEIRDNRGSRLIDARSGPAGLVTLVIPFKGTDVVRQLHVRGRALEIARGAATLSIRPLEWPEQRIEVITDWTYTILHFLAIFEGGLSLWQIVVALAAIALAVLIVRERGADQKRRSSDHGLK